MEFFEKARTVRLKGVHGKYLWADEDCYKVFQCKEPMNILAHWRVERDTDSRLIRLKSCHQTYLTASDDDFLMGMTGKKAVQSKPKHVDSSIEWEPIKEGPKHFKLKTCHGNFLRANKALGPPWRNSVTHDIPHRMQKHQDYLLWEIEIVWEANMSSVSNGLHSYKENRSKLEGAHKPYVSALPNNRNSLSHSNSISDDDDDDAAGPSPPHSISASARHSHSTPSTYSDSSPQRFSTPAPKPDGRTIYYAFASSTEEARRLDDSDWPSFTFKGHTLKALKKQLQEVLDIDEDVLLCARHQSSNMYQLTLPTLPPKNAAMHIVVVKVSSSLKRSKSGHKAVTENDGDNLV